MKTKIILIVVLCIVLAFSSAFFVINFDTLFPNDTNVEQIQPDKPGNNGSETPDDSTDKPSEEPNEPTDDIEQPLQPGENIEITISRDKITF